MNTHRIGLFTLLLVLLAACASEPTPQSLAISPTTAPIYTPAAATATLTPTATAVPPTLAPTRTPIPWLPVSVDPRLEMLSIVQFLGSYQKNFGLMTTLNFDYKADMVAHFGGFGEHTTVTLFDDMSMLGFSYDAPLELMLHLSNPPELEVQRPLPDDLINRAGGQDNVDAFLQALRDFAIETDFAQFWQAHGDFYEAVAQANRISTTPINQLEAYLGMAQHSYAVIIVPLYTAAGYGPRVQQADGRYALYAVTGTKAVSNQMPRTANIDLLMWHEFSHSFINPLTEAHWDEIVLYEAAAEPAIAQLRKNGITAYNQWSTIFNENVVRAVTARLLTQTQGEAAGQSQLDLEQEWGFIYTDELAKALRHYESERDTFATIADFYPQLIAVFANE